MFRILIRRASCVLLFITLPVLVFAQSSQGSTSQESVTDQNCPEFIPPESGSEAGIPQGSLEVASSTRWQPVHGEFKFTLSQLASQPQNVRVWFQWEDGTRTCKQSTRVQFLGKPAAVEDDKSTKYSYSARLPRLDSNPHGFPWIEGQDHLIFTSAVPLADMYVRAYLKDDKGSTTVLTVARVGVSTPWLAIVVALALVGLAWAFLLSWADARKVPGKGLLRVISTPHGVASLSQFQIAIWTTIIGAGIIYVMLISGDLIDIPGTTLGLLGVTGLTLVGSKIQAGSDGTPQRLSAPGLVGNLVVMGAPTTDTVVLSWDAPTGTQQPFTYTVQQRRAGGGGWTTVVTNIGAPPYAVIGLTPATAYEFQVFALNAGGAGPASLPVSASTVAAAAAAAPGVAPNQVTALTANASADGAVSLQWPTINPAPNTYVVQYRPAGDLPWGTYRGTGNGSAVVADLDSSTTFEFMVFAITNGVAGVPSPVATATTPPRIPQWSDLVMSGDSDVEIDLSRVQMLLFTSIAAAFTGMTLLDTGEIPNIPLGVLALVGLSNGVYLASKSVGQSKPGTQ